MKKWFHTLSAQILNTLLWVFPYQLTVSILLAVLTALLNRIGLFFVASAGEAAITNGNYRVFFSRWQGWALLALGVLACALYICLDIGALIRITDLKIHGQKERILTSCMHSLKLLPKFFTPSGLLILLAVTFGVPLANIGFSITLTEGFYIPNVYSVDLMSNPVTRAIYDIGIACLAILITKGIFTIHFMVLQKDSAKNAFLHSAELTKSFFIRFLILFLLLTILFYASLFLIGLQFGAVTLMPMIMTADCVDYYEYETGKRMEGAAYSILTLTIKVCLALGTALGLVFVGLSGYSDTLKQIDAGTVSEFSTKTKDIIFFAYTALPGILALLSIIPMFKYDIVGDKKEAISRALGEKRK